MILSGYRKQNIDELREHLIQEFDGHSMRQLGIELVEFIEALVDASTDETHDEAVKTVQRHTEWKARYTGHWGDDW